jgi:16S rRNA C967 or C1407 C5-methylase (RsmB/RsmF family)/NOL1/NOP2/fmu family ribosome biogenesis protein
MRSLSKLDHFDPDAFLAVHQSGEQLVSVHMNPDKPIYKEGKWNADIPEAPFEFSGAVPWAPDAFYLTARPQFTLDPFFHAGNYYVQEASGMFLAHALKKVTGIQQNLKVLDLCAAPGGKSTLIQSLISKDSLLVSNEVIKTRIPVLYQNITKWGQANNMVTNNDPAHFKKLSGFFDIMLIDAPCSGSGLFRKDPEAAANWSMDLVNLCSQRQRRILADAWDCLKEDGYLIYSTCSYATEENEDILDSIFREYSCLSVPLDPDPEWGIIETKSAQAGAYGYRFYPDKVSGEGFYISVLQKKQSVTTVRSPRTNQKLSRLEKTIEKQVSQWIDKGSHSFISVGEGVHVLPSFLENDFEILKNTLYLKKAGVRIGKAGEHDWIPDHELALANILKPEAAQLVVEKPDAIRFLKGESPEMSIREKGWRVVVYQGQRLGWVKLLEKRMNNYYPKSWRIRK